MAKISSKSNLVLGTNVFLHIADKGGTDISIDATNGTIDSTTTDFTASSSSGGITNRAIAVGDTITVSHTANNGNEGIILTVDAVSATEIQYTVSSGTPVNESAGADINIVASAKSYQFAEAGGLSFVDGVEGAILHSKLQDLRQDSDLDRYPPIFASIEPRAKSMASINGWEPHDSNTLKAIRDTALEIRPSATATATKIYSLFRTNGTLHAASDQMTVWSTADSELTAPASAVMTGYLNELFLIFDSINSIDKRGNWAVRCAEPGKTILYSVQNIQFAEIITVPDNNEIDPKLADPGTGTPFTSDSTIAAGGVYANIDYNLDADGLFTGDVNGTDYTFAGFVEGDNKTNEQIHEKINYLWRQSGDVNSDGTGAAKRGDKQPPLTAFSGDVFTVQSYVENFNAAQRNNLRLVDTSLASRAWPTSRSVIITAPAIAHGGELTVWHANTHGTSSAVALRNDSDVAQQDLTIAANIAISVAFSTYDIDGHTPNTPLDLLVSFNRPGFVESSQTDVFTLTSTADLTIPISPVPDPSYVS